MEADPDRIVADGQLTMSDAAWEQAKSRAAVIGALATRRVTGIAAADEAAMKLGVSRRQVYVLLGRYRQGSGLVTDLALHRSTGGKGGNRLPEQVEDIVRGLIRRRFLTRQKLRVAALHREIIRACALQGIKAPTGNTVSRRISMLNPVEVGRRREGRDAVRPLQSAGGEVPVIGSILEQVQIDHTVIDVRERSAERSGLVVAEGMPAGLSPPVPLVLAKVVSRIPAASALPGGCLYEPKWDGFLHWTSSSQGRRWTVVSSTSCAAAGAARDCDRFGWPR